MGTVLALSSPEFSVRTLGLDWHRPGAQPVNRGGI